MYLTSQSPSYKAFVSVLDSEHIPHTIQEALTRSSLEKVVQDEINGLVKNGTWEISKLPNGKRSVRCKWVFIIKHKAVSSIEWFEARLVAKGFTQSYGILSRDLCAFG